MKMSIITIQALVSSYAESILYNRVADSLGYLVSQRLSRSELNSKQLQQTQDPQRAGREKEHQK